MSALILGLLFLAVRLWEPVPQCLQPNGRANEHPVELCLVEHLVAASPMNQHLISPLSLLSTVIPIYLTPTVDMHKAAAL